MTGSRISRNSPSRTFDRQEALKLIQGEKPYSDLTARFEQTDTEDVMFEALDVIIPWIASASMELSLTEHCADVYYFNRICLHILECGGECGLVHLLCAGIVPAQERGRQRCRTPQGIRELGEGRRQLLRI